MWQGVWHDLHKLCTHKIYKCIVNFDFSNSSFHDYKTETEGHMFFYANVSIVIVIVCQSKIHKIQIHIIYEKNTLFLWSFYRLQKYVTPVQKQRIRPRRNSTVNHAHVRVAHTFPLILSCVAVPPPQESLPCRKHRLLILATDDGK